MQENKDKQIALAAVCQAAKLVQSIARKGHCDEQAFNASIHSIIVTDPDSTLSIFGELQDLKVGFQTLLDQLAHQSANKDAEVTRYIAGILGLERKLAQRGKALDELGQRISHVQRQYQHTNTFDSQVLSSLASIYKDVISPLGTKIQVAGTPEKLSMSNNQNNVRALLLAGVRAAVLWRQLGGQRRQILFSRSKIMHAANQCMQHINQSN